MIGSLNKEQLEIIRLLVWEKLVRNPEYRKEYFEVICPRIEDGLAAHMEKYNAFVEKWNLPTPLHPDWSWEDIAEYKDSWEWFMGHSIQLFRYPGISKTFLKKLARQLSKELPQLKDATEELPKMANKRFSTKWETAYRVYDLCEVEGRTEEEAATIIKAETKGKVRLTVQAIHEMKKRVYELVYGESFPSKRERRKRQFEKFPPCANCIGRDCEDTKEIRNSVCEEMERWFEYTMTLPDEKTRTELTVSDNSRAARELAAYLAYPPCVFENPDTGDSFTYHSPEAVKVFLHVSSLHLNWISNNREDDFFCDP